MSDTQKGSGDGALNDIGPGSLDEGKEKAGTSDGHHADGHPRAGHRLATGATGFWVSSKRTAGDANLNEGGEGVPKSEKVQRTGLSAAPIATYRG